MFWCTPLCSAVRVPTVARPLPLTLQDEPSSAAIRRSSNFPTFAAIQPEFGGVFDAFATVLDPLGASFILSSYFGGSGDDRGYAVAAAPGNQLYLAGITSSSNFPVVAPIQPGLSVAPDAFALRLTYITGVPTADSVTPSLGSGASQNFALQYSDTNGTGSLLWVWAWFGASIGSGANSCVLYYQPSTNQVNLLNDAGAAWTAATLGGASTLRNSQCSVYAAGTSVLLNGNSLTLNVAITFNPAFSGAKNIYMYSADISGSNTGWLQRGGWTVPSGSGVSAAVSVTPSSGAGASQSFTLQYSDTVGATSLLWTWAWFNGTLGTGANSCLLYYQPSTNQMNLMNDAGTAWMAATPGAATTLQNSQCSLNLAAISAILNGNTLTLNLAVTFQTRLQWKSERLHVRR